MLSNYQSEDITTLAKAMLQVQMQLQPALKDATNPFTNSNYATLKSVMDTCREALLGQGIWLTQYPVPVPEYVGTGHLGLVTKLTHAESGQWQASLAVVPLPKNDPQGMGIAMTYSRRYALSAMLGMVTEDDLDGELQKPNKTPQTRAAKPSAPKPPASSPSYVQSPAPQVPVQDASGRANPVAQAQTPTASPVSKGQAQTQAASPELPRIDGVTYQTTTTQDGKPCIIASGNTQPKKELLAHAGFRWNPERKFWWKYADAA